MAEEKFWVTDWRIIKTADHSLLCQSSRWEFSNKFTYAHNPVYYFTIVRSRFACNIAQSISKINYTTYVAAGSIRIINYDDYHRLPDS